MNELKHRFVEANGDYDLYCNGVMAGFVPSLIARNQMIHCPICGEGANYQEDTPSIEDIVAAVNDLKPMNYGFKDKIRQARNDQIDEVIAVIQSLSQSLD